MNLGAPEPALTLSKGLDFETWESPDSPVGKDCSPNVGYSQVISMAMPNFSRFTTKPKTAPPPLYLRQNPPESSPKVSFPVLRFIAPKRAHLNHDRHAVAASLQLPSVRHLTTCLVGTNNTTYPHPTRGFVDSKRLRVRPIYRPNKTKHLHGTQKRKTAQNPHF